MCRLAAYIGPRISLAQFLLKPAHSLMEQSWRPRELKDARLNADGYGFGWFGPEQAPARYLSAMPIWSDGNLPAIAPSLFAKTWAANVRSATPGLMNHVANTQPFADDQFLFLHNGFVMDFARVLRPRIRNVLAPEIEATVHGNTDSEHLFALWRHLRASKARLPPEEALTQLLALVTDWLDGEQALLNIVLTDGERIYATRHAINGDCPSLYYIADDETYPDGLLVASEPLTESAYWRPVPSHHFLILDPRRPPTLLPL